MPSADLFVQFGFLARKHFLDAEDCKRLIVEASEAPTEKGRLVRHGVDKIIDEKTRKVCSARVCKATRLRLKQRFLEIVPEIETHFGIPLAGCETPGVLIYETGDFFAPHTDTGPDDPPDIRPRRVSAIVFLNQPSTERGDGFRGGTLRFHGLLDGPHWANCPLPLEPEPGLLLAFRSEVLHEVQPVISGRRFTIVTWFLAR